ncbi:MAG: primosomal protein N', partial [Deltaproteobacteria bacterium]|nr:primosomal protein N' [Deltaproteobacteria bacterium]
ARMDRDTMRRRHAHHRLLDGMEKGEVDVLIGTQMVAKGHHFPEVTVVGVVSADTPLHIPDFRSTERTFQLITQVAGRAGRGEVPGEVIVQTLNPEHYCLQKALAYDYIGFFEEELERRREVFYPPFCRLINLRLEGNNEKRVLETAKRLKGVAVKTLEGFRADVQVLGPAPAFLYKLRGRYRWQMMVKGRDVKRLHQMVGMVLAGFHEKRLSGVDLIVDVDPAITV